MNTTIRKSSGEGETIGECLGDDLIFRYTEGTASAAEAEAVQDHLDSCTTCLAVIAAAAKMPAGPPSKADFMEFERAVHLHPERVLSRLLGRTGPGPLRKLWEKIKELLLEIINRTKDLVIPRTEPNPIPVFVRVAFAVVAVVVVGGGSFWGIRSYRINSHINLVQETLRKQHKIYVNINSFADKSEPRLSGGYSHTPLFLMGPKEEALANMEAVMAASANSVKVKHLLVQYYIIEKDYLRADSVLKQIDAEDLQSAELLNDRGALYFAQEKWEEAASSFEAAIRADAKFPEARYNLALTKIELGKKDEAISILSAMLEIETDAGWRGAAENVLQNLKE